MLFCNDDQNGNLTLYDSVKKRVATLIYVISIRTVSNKCKRHGIPVIIFILLTENETFNNKLVSLEWIRIQLNIRTTGTCGPKLNLYKYILKREINVKGLK